MQTEQKLNNAPIREAIIDIRTDAEVQEEDIQSVAALLPRSYGQLSPTFQKGFALSFNEGSVETTQEETLIGYRSDDVERRFVAQFHKNGLTVSKLAPYDSWDEFKLEAKTLWENYKPILGNYNLKRVATRYINEINLPITNGRVDFDQYLTNCPRTPNGMPDVLGTFLSRVAVPIEDPGALAVVTLNLSNGAQDAVSVILDIDVYRDQKLDMTENELWALLESLRTVKNKAFFGSITEEAKSLFS